MLKEDNITYVCCVFSFNPGTRRYGVRIVSRYCVGTYMYVYRYQVVGTYLDKFYIDAHFSTYPQQVPIRIRKHLLQQVYTIHTSNQGVYPILRFVDSRLEHRMAEQFPLHKCPVSSVCSQSPRHQMRELASTYYSRYIYICMYLLVIYSRYSYVLVVAIRVRGSAPAFALKN